VSDAELKLSGESIEIELLLLYELRSQVYGELGRHEHAVASAERALALIKVKISPETPCSALALNH
jgi:hypothetical protein